MRASKRVGVALEQTDEGYGTASECSVEATVAVIGGRWKPLILHRLRSSPLHHGELRRRLPGITQRMLTAQLRSLEADGIVRRNSVPDDGQPAPARVMYALTDLGQSLMPVLEAMGRWGREYARCVRPVEGR